MCFKRYGQGVRCQVCADFDERRSQLTSKKERQEIDELKQQHLNRCDMDRSDNVQGQPLVKAGFEFQDGELLHQLPQGAGGREWIKQNFDVPRNLKANAAFANVQRPALHLTGAVAIGLCEVYYILGPDTKKDSNMVATCLAHLLDRCQLVVENRPDYCLPRHLIIGADNCTRETKNAYLAQFGAFLVGRGIFDSVEFQFMVTGHTKE